MRWKPPAENWVRHLLFPPAEIHIRMECTVSGPHGCITYTTIVQSPDSDEELYVSTYTSFGASVLPEIAVSSLREALAAARVAASPF